MKRADKIRLAEAAAAEAAVKDERDPAERIEARQEWGRVRKAVRDAWEANGDWRAILDEYRDREGFYTPAERAKMCTECAEGLVMRMAR